MQHRIHAQQYQDHPLHFFHDAILREINVTLNKKQEIRSSGLLRRTGNKEDTRSKKIETRFLTPKKYPGGVTDCRKNNNF
jgi:hypothetical protein